MLHARRWLALPLLATAALGASWGAPNDGGSAPPPTFHRDVTPLLQRHCQDCHRPAGSNYGGMRAPMSLVSYDEARPWAKSIAKQVQSREMPPWDAAPQHNGVFKNERVLADAEIATLVR